jgi:hypothetical protein
LVLMAALGGCGDDTSQTATGTDAAAGPDTDAGGDLDGSAEADSGEPADVVTEPELAVEVLVDGESVRISNGISEDFEFEVPENVVSVVVMVEVDGNTTVNLAAWEQVDGDPLVPLGWTDTDQNAPQLCTESCDNRVVASESVFAALAPNNEVPTVVAGTHRIRLVGLDVEGFQGSPATTDAFVTVYVKVLPEPPLVGTINLNLHFTGAGWDAEEAQTDPEFVGIMTRFEEIYDTIGIEFGEVNYFDIGEEFQVVDGISGADNDLERLFEQSAGNPGEGVNVFFVSELRQGGPFGDFGVLLGIAGGIPGPVLVQGTARNGVAIAVDAHGDPQLPIDADIANTTAHEVGHYLGLFHTSEQALFGPQIHDPIGDTPENDETWLMHNTGSGGRLSVTQGVVVRGNPWIQH